MKLFNINQIKFQLIGDKSIAHRAIILASLNKNKNIIRNFPKNDDVLTTLNALSKFGLIYESNNDTLYIDSSKINFNKKNIKIECNESGTTARLLLGLLVGKNINAILSGSNSLLSRPMKRVISPFQEFGANIDAINNRLPLTVNKSIHTAPFEYNLKVASAQVKSSLILYAMNMNGISILMGKIETRDHLERLLLHLGYPIKIFKDKIKIKGNVKIKNKIDIKIPGDISSAAFLMCACILKVNSSIIINDVCLNNYRTGFIDAVIKMGGKICITNKKNMFGDEVGDIKVSYSSNLHGIQIDKKEIVTMIDEVPILSVLALFADGNTVIKGIDELKIKESNRVDAIIANIKLMGGQACEKNGSLIIKGGNRLYNTNIKSYNDHRIFMSFFIANSIISAKFQYDKNDKSYTKSFPDFIDKINEILS